MPTTLAQPQCPRCGYAMTGAVTAWKEQCPLEGRCPEGGLEFWWRDALNPDFTQPKWCVEFGSGATGLWRAVRTTAMLFAPRRFWRELQMWHEPRMHRIALLIVPFVVMIYLAFALSAGFGTFQRVHAIVIRGGNTPRTPLTAGLASFAQPWTQIRYSEFRIMEAGWRAVRYGVSDGLFTSDHPSVVPERMFTLCVMIVLAPAGFILLPLSRRIAKVRWRHIARISLYSLAILAIPVMADIFDQVAIVARAGIGEFALGVSAITVFALCAWWASATTRYLRMPHGWVVGAFVVGFAYLLQRAILEAIDMLIAFV